MSILMDYGQDEFILVVVSRILLTSAQKGSVKDICRGTNSGFFNITCGICRW